MTKPVAKPVVAEPFSFPGSDLNGLIGKSISSLSDYQAHSKANLEAAVASVTVATKGAETLGAQLIALSKASLEHNVAAAKALSSGRSPQDVFELQTAWAKSSMEVWLAGLGQASETAAVVFKESVAPISARVTAVVESFQPAR